MQIKPKDFPAQIDLNENLRPITPAFHHVWQKVMQKHCHEHPVWESDFARKLRSTDTDEKERFELAAVWSANMVVGSYCFPRYVAALAARAPQDVVRHGLLENAWDESGSHGHTSRSHFWLAVRLARLLGLSDAKINAIHPIPAALKYTNEHYRQCAEGNAGFALGMISLIEEFTTPEFTLIFKSFLRSSKIGLGLNADDFVLKGGAEYFTANIADDERHREEMPRIVSAYISANGADLSNEKDIEGHMEQVAKGVRQSADLRQEFFEGIAKFVENGKSYKDLSS